MKIFVVDDHRDIAEGLAEVLRLQGHEVDVAFGGEQAVRMFKENDYDIAFMDVMMPGMNGVESFLAIRRHKPNAKVVMMTGYSVEQLLDQVVEKGAYGVLHKPVIVDDILKTLERVKSEGLVLIADANPQFGSSIKGVLEQNGYRTVNARSGKEALAKAMEGGVDIMLLGKELPILSGIEVYMELRKRSRDIPTVIVTEQGASYDSDLDSLYNFNTTGILTKPFNTEQLLKSLGQFRDGEDIHDSGSAVSAPPPVMSEPAAEPDAVRSPAPTPVSGPMPNIVKPAPAAPAPAPAPNIVKPVPPVDIPAAPAADEMPERRPPVMPMPAPQAPAPHNSTPPPAAPQPNTPPASAVPSAPMPPAPNPPAPAAPAPTVQETAPSAPQASTPPAPPPMPAVQEEKRPQGRIIAVDDDVDMVDGLAEVLRTRGYEVKTANNEEEAFAVIKEFDAQLALLDIRLGKTSGLDLIKSLKEYRPNLQSIMITGNADRESAIAALQRGAYNYLTKPLHPDELFAIMDTCLDKYELDEKLRASFEELQVAKEEAEEKIRHISGFYGEIGASVDAMVKEIQAASEKLAQPGDDGSDDRQQLVKAINGIAARIESVVNNAADLAKLKAFTLELDEGAVDICKLVSNCVRAARDTIGEGGPEVKVSVPEESVPVWGDERLLKLVILNLLSNSVDFTPEDGDITLSVRREENGDPVIQVTDTSTGMPIDQIREAVQNFGRKVDTGGANGSLDIVLVSNIARLHDGELEFVSNPEGGVTARITLPAKRVFSAQSAA